MFMCSCSLCQVAELARAEAALEAAEVAKAAEPAALQAAFEAEQAVRALRRRAGAPLLCLKCGARARVHSARAQADRSRAFQPPNGYIYRPSPPSPVAPALAPQERVAALEIRCVDIVIRCVVIRCAGPGAGGGAGQGGGAQGGGDATPP